MAKHVLTSSGDEFDFALIAISCVYDQYETVALLDAALGTSFYLSDELPYNLKDNRLFNFSLFRYSDEELGLEYSLLPNLSNFEKLNENSMQQTDLFADQAVEERVRLIREMPKADYFLIIKGEDKFRCQHLAVDKLRGQDGIMQVQAVDPKDLASRRNLIL